MLGGMVIPAKVATMIGEKQDLRLWATLVTGTSGSLKSLHSTDSAQSSSSSTSAATIDDTTKTALLRVLLGVYMRGGAAMADRTAHLLNSQAMNLDVADVISLVPPDWSLSVISSFLTRSFRRTLHERNEGQIVKALSSGLNLKVADESWSIIREHGYVVEEAADDNPDDEKASHDEAEPQSLNEKASLPMDIPQPASKQEDIMEIRVGSHSEAGLSPRG